MERTFVDHLAANNLFDGAQTDMNAILNSLVVIRNDIFFIALLLLRALSACRGSLLLGFGGRLFGLCVR